LEAIVAPFLEVESRRVTVLAMVDCEAPMP
jgi:hypothetical protein